MPPVRHRDSVHLRNILRKNITAYVKRRFTRSWGAGETDFIPYLPTEVVHIIFQQLCVQDLAKCLLVSKKWHALANDDMLWKRKCIENSVDTKNLESKKFFRDTSSNLCKWAQIWRSYRNSPAYGWRTCTWKSIVLERDGIYSKNASDGELLVFCTGSKLTCRSVSQFGKTKCTVSIPLPADASSSLAVDNKYIAVAKCNIVLIYKLCVNSYKCVLGISMDGDYINHSKKYIARFIKNHLKENTACINIIALIKGCIWLREQGHYKTFVVNIATERVTQVETHFYRFVTRMYIVSWSRRKLRVDNYSGRNVLKLSRDINKARANHHVLVTFCFTCTGVDYEQVMETWDLSTGNRLLCMTRPKQAFFEIHPSRDILYQIEATNDTVTSLCPLTGDVFWTVKVPTMEDILDWCLRVVCGQFLVLFQLKAVPSAENSMYVFDALNGDYLYKSDRPPGHLEHLSDNLLIAKTSNKLYLRTFSGNS